MSTEKIATKSSKKRVLFPSHASKRKPQTPRLMLRPTESLLQPRLKRSAQGSKQKPKRRQLVWLLRPSLRLCALRLPLMPRSLTNSPGKWSSAVWKSIGSKRMVPRPSSYHQRPLGHRWGAQWHWAWQRRWEQMSNARQKRCKDFHSFKQFYLHFYISAQNVVTVLLRNFYACCVNVALVRVKRLPYLKCQALLTAVVRVTSLLLRVSPFSLTTTTATSIKTPSPTPFQQ